jgi:hypothetical protein
MPRFGVAVRLVSIAGISAMLAMNGPLPTAAGPLRPARGHPAAAPSPEASNVGSTTTSGSSVRFEENRLIDWGDWVYAASVTVADVTGDGRADVLATIDATCPCSLMYFEQRPNGTLASTPTSVAMAGDIYGDQGIATADFNADGMTDVAVASGHGVDVFLATSGNLAPATEYPILGVNSDQVEAGDVTGDGKDDIVVSGTEIDLLTNTGSGFSTSSVASGSRQEIELGDVTGDGRLDLVTSAGWYSDTLQVFPNDGVGGFDTPASYALPDSIVAIAVGDLTGDGRLDVITVGGGNNARVYVLQQTLAGTLAPPTDYQSLDIPDTAETVDLNGDGRDDLVVGHGVYHSIGYYLQRSDGTLSSERYRAIPYMNFDPKGVAAGDVNGDGQPDLVFGSDVGLLLLVQAAELPIRTPQSVRYGGDASFTVHLGPYESTGNQKVRVFTQTVGDEERLMKSGIVDASGDLHGRLTNLEENTTLIARWSGDSRSAAVETKRPVGVSVITTGQLSGYFDTSGKYKLYRPGVDPRYAGTVVPNHSGKTMMFELQKETSSGWKDLDSLYVKIGSSGTANVLVRAGALARGVHYRIRASFYGDRDHDGDHAPWAYFRVT